MVSGAGAGVWRQEIMPKTPVCCLAGQTPAPASGAPDKISVKNSCLVSGAPDAGAGAWLARQKNCQNFLLTVWRNFAGVWRRARRQPRLAHYERLFCLEIQ